MAVVTVYDTEVNEWKDKLELATDKQAVAEAKSQLMNLAKQRWDSVNDLGTLSAEIDARLRAYKSESNNQGVYKAAYQRWKDILKKGVDADSLRAARNLLIQADQTVFSRLAQNRTDYLEKHPVVTDDELSGSTTIGGGVSTAVRNSNGAYVLTTDKDTVTVKSESLQQSVAKKTPSQDPNYLDRRPAWIDTNIEYHRTKTAEGLAVDSAYIKRYYSVIDAEVYFGNEYVEDIADINWSVKQNVMPVFGYNSYTYDELARGNRIIFGSFLINFTSPNYLFSILEEANKANVISITNMQNYTVPLLKNSAEPQIRGGTVGTRERGHHANIWPQTFDIDIIFGEKTGAGDPVHILLLGCAIQDCQMALSANASGSPPVVMERYSFVAQDIRTVVSSNGNDVTDKVTNSVAEAIVYEDDNNVTETDTDKKTETDNNTKDQQNALEKLKVSKENKEMAEYYKKLTEEAKTQDKVVSEPHTVVMIPALITYLKDLQNKIEQGVPVSGTDDTTYYRMLKQQYYSSTQNTITFRVLDNDKSLKDYTFTKEEFDAWGKSKSYYSYNEE